MKKDRKTIFNYLSEQVIGRFTGFMVGLWASRLISHFFTTRSIHNLWGLTARKTVVSKQTFGNLEWIASVVIGSASSTSIEKNIAYAHEVIPDAFWEALKSVGIIPKHAPTV